LCLNYHFVIRVIRVSFLWWSHRKVLGCSVTLPVRKNGRAPVFLFPISWTLSPSPAPSGALAVRKDRPRRMPSHFYPCSLRCAALCIVAAAPLQCRCRAPAIHTLFDSFGVRSGVRCGPCVAFVPAANSVKTGGGGRNRTRSRDFFKIHYSAITTPPPEANSLITNERQ
jgi:hypothetical protein